MRYLDGSVSYVRSDYAIALAKVRYGAHYYWERVRSVPNAPRSLITDDHRVIYGSEVQEFIPLPTPEEVSGSMLGYSDLLARDASHAAIAQRHGIVWTVENNPCKA